MKRMRRMRIKNRIIRDTPVEDLNQQTMQALAGFMEVATPTETPVQQAINLRLELELALRQQGYSQEELQEMEDELLNEKDTKK